MASEPNGSTHRGRSTAAMTTWGWGIVYLGMLIGFIAGCWWGTGHANRDAYDQGYYDAIAKMRGHE